MNRLGSRILRFLLLLLVGWSLTAASVLPGLVEGYTSFFAEIATGQMSPVPAEEQRGGDSTTDGGDENESPGHVPPCFPLATPTSVSRFPLPCSGTEFPDVYLELFIPPQNLS